MSLEEMRREIDQIDERLMGLLNRRAECALEIGREKKRTGTPLQDPEREEEVLAYVRERNKGPLSDGAVEAIYGAIIKECSRIQRVNSD